MKAGPLSSLAVAALAFGGAASGQGMAVATAARDAATATVRGTFTVDNRPAVREEVELHRSRNQHKPLKVIRTNERGLFVVRNVPPGAYYLVTGTMLSQGKSQCSGRGVDIVRIAFGNFYSIVVASSHFRVKAGQTLTKNIRVSCT